MPKPVLAGNRFNRRVNASNPPAEAPTPTIGGAKAARCVTADFREPESFLPLGFISSFFLTLLQ
jgi:hypothetical protein